jgi:hypothetical protein
LSSTSSIKSRTPLTFEIHRSSRLINSPTRVKHWQQGYY